MRQKKFFHWAWIILAICFLNLLINYSVRLGFGVVLPEMIRTLGFGRTAGGTIYNSLLIVYVSLAPFTGYMTDRLGARRVITACTLFLGLGTMLMGTVQNFWQACLFFAITGLGSSGIWVPVLTLVQRWFAKHRRGLAMGVVSTGYGLGFAAIGAVFPWIVAYLNWRYAWFFLGGMALVTVFINGFLLRSDPKSSGLEPWGHREAGGMQAVEKTLAKEPLSPKILMQDSRFWIIGFSYFAITYSCYGITTFMVDYAKYQLELPLEKAAYLATLHGFGQVAGVLTVLPLSDFFGRKKTIVVSSAFIMASLVGVMLVGSSWSLLYVCIGCLGIFYGAIWPTFGLCAGDYFPPEAIGTVVGAWTPFYGAGAVAANWVTGILRDTTGVYDHAIIIFIGTAAASVVLMSLVRKPALQI